MKATTDYKPTYRSNDYLATASTDGAGFYGIEFADEHLSIGDVVEVDYKSNAGGAWSTDGLSTTRGTLVEAYEAWGDVNLVIDDESNGRYVRVETDILGQIKSLAGKSARSMGRVKAVRTVEEHTPDDDVLSRFALRFAEPGEVYTIDGEERLVTHVEHKSEGGNKPVKTHMRHVPVGGDVADETTTFVDERRAVRVDAEFVRQATDADERLSFLGHSEGDRVRVEANDGTTFEGEVNTIYSRDNGHRHSLTVLTGEGYRVYVSDPVTLGGDAPTMRVVDEFEGIVASIESVDDEDEQEGELVADGGRNRLVHPRVASIDDGALVRLVHREFCSDRTVRTEPLRRIGVTRLKGWSGGRRAIAFEVHGQTGESYAVDVNGSVFHRYTDDSLAWTAVGAIDDVEHVDESEHLRDEFGDPVADGGEEPAINVGDLVVDTEQEPDERNEAVVLRVLDDVAGDVEVANTGKTVYEFNEDVDDVTPASRVVEVAFTGTLDERFAAWTRTPALELHGAMNSHADAWDVSINTYSYPVERLDVEGHHEPATEPESEEFEDFM